MADKPISSLSASTTPLAGTEVLPIVQSSTTKKVAVSDLTAGRAVSAASLTLTTTALSVGNGGTGTTTHTTGQLVKGNGTNALSASILRDDGTQMAVGRTPLSGVQFYVANTSTDGTLRVDCAPGGFTSQITFGAIGFSAVAGFRFVDPTAQVTMFADGDRSAGIATNGVDRVRIKSNGQTRFIPLATAPASAEAGDVYYDSGTNKLRCYNGTSWNDLF